MDNLLFKAGNAGQVNIDQAQGIVECFVAGIGNKDSVGDVVISGAFAKSLLRRKPRVVWGHSWNDPIGKVLEMYEVPVGDSRLPAKMRNAGIGGLYAKVQFNLNSEKGKEAFATVAFFGEEQEWSIGYKTIDSVFDPNLQANILKEVELYEVSPVLHGANQLTGTISIKGDEKGHMPIISMPGMGMPTMPQVPRIVVVAAPQGDENEASEGNPFSEGMARELSPDEKNALQAELSDRTGSTIEILNATENSVVFRRTTTDGKTSMYRLSYHREGDQYMFGKPEPYAAEEPKPQAMQNIEQKPDEQVVVPNGGIAYRTSDHQEMMNMFGGSAVEKSEISHLIELPEQYMAGAKEFLAPVLRHHKLVGQPSAKGIIVNGQMTANALDALHNAIKALGSTIGQVSGNIGQAIGKIRDLAQTFNPYALDGDGDGFVQDGSAFMRPYIPIKKPGFDLPDIRGRKRSGDALLDKPRSAPKLPKDKNTWNRAQRNEALTSGLIEPETREDVAFLANKRPDNEGLAKYWDMSDADLAKEGNKLTNARRQATGSEKEKIDEELLKLSHEFQRRASYQETFGQEFTPPAKRESADAMVPEADKPKPATPKRTAEDGLASAGSVFDSLNEGNLDERGEFLDWDELDEDDQLEFMQEIEYDYMFEEHGNLGDDGIVEALESGDYEDEIREHAEELYDKIKARRIKKRDEEDAKNEREENERYAQSDAGRAEAAEEERQAREDAADYEREKEQEEELKRRARDRALDEQADAALDRAMEGYIDKYGEEGFASRSSDKAKQNLRDLVTGELAKEDEYWTLGDDESKNYEIINEFFANYDDGLGDEQFYDAAEELLKPESGLTDKQKEFAELVQSAIENNREGAYMRQQERDREEYYGGDRPTRLRTTESQRDIDDAIARYEDGDFGFRPEESRAAEDFDRVLEKFDKMWGFDVPDEDEAGWNEPFGFASRGNDEEVQQSKLNELVSGVKDRLIAELETADPATWKPSWRNDSLPINPITGKPYKGWNAFFLMLAAHDRKYSTGRFAGFNQLKARGAIVRKGEKGQPILRPQLVKKEDKDGNIKEFVVFRGATVFNIDQTDGGDEALRAIPADLPESERIAILDETLKELGVTVQTANMTPHYDPDGDYISMPDFAKGTSALEWTSTLAHEAVHWTGHKSRMDRASLRDYSSDRAVRAYEELVAEIGSAMLLAAHGIEAPFRQDHAPYIKGWIQLLKDDPEALNKAFKDAQAAINFMLEKSPNLRKLFGGIDTGKKSPDVDAPDKVDALVGASDGFSSLHRVRTPGSSALGGILYDDNSKELMVGFLKGKSWDDLDDDARTKLIDDYLERRRDVGGYKPRMDDTQIDNIVKDLYEDSREIGWYVYSDVSMEEVSELAAARSKGRHINALKKLKKARKASDEDQFNFFGRDERVQDVTKSDGFASVGTAMHPSYTRDSVAQWWLIARSEGARGRQGGSKQYLVRVEKRPDGMYVVKKYFGKDENQPIGRLQSTTEGPFRDYAVAKQVGAAAARAKMPKYLLMYDNIPSRDTEDGFASRGAKKLGVEPRYQDRDWINRTQERILKSGLDFQSLSENDRIDWANSFLNEYLNENDMGHGLSDVANGRRLNTRPDIELLNYAEEAYARMSDAHMARRAQFGRDEDGFASVGIRTMRINAKPSKAVDYISYDPDSESLYVAYKREDGRGDMYVYEGVSMAEATGVGNAESVGKAINDIKRRKNVRKATPEEIMSLAESERYTNDRTLPALRVNKLSKIQQAIHSDSRFKLGSRESRIDDDEGGRLILSERDDTRLVADWNPETGKYQAYIERYESGGREEPGEWVRNEGSLSVFFDDSNHTTMLDELLRLNEERELALDSDARIERELADAKRELDMAGDAPGVESVDVTYSSALDAVDYNPSTQELRVSYKDGGTYIYEGVDRITFEEFKTAPSKGRAMNEIKRAHPYRKDGEWAGGGDEEGGIEEFDVRGSEAVEKVTYDPSKEELTVVYSGGKGYVYSGVTREEADAVRSAPSKGRAINDVKRTHDVRKVSAEDKGKDTPKPSESTRLSAGETNQYLRIARSVADQIVNNPESGVKDPAYDDRNRGLYYPEWDVVPDWMKEEQIKWMNENKPKASGTYTADEVGEMFNAARELLMNTGVKGAERKVTSGRKIPKSDLDRFEKEARESLFDMMRKTYDSLLMSNDYDKEKAARRFAEMFDGNTIEFVSDSAVLSGDVPIVDADGDRIDPLGYKIRPVRGFDQYERVIPAGADVGATSIDPAPAPRPRVPTRKPPRGGKRVRNRNVTISMEQGALDEIIEAEGKNTTVDALRAARGVGSYTKGPRKGKRRGPDTIAVRDAETGELLHANEIELTSSSANWYEGRKQGASPTGRKRGYIRARSYAGRQGHNVVSDEGPNLRGEGKGMTDYDKRVYGLGSDEKNREAGLASRGSMRDRISQYIDDPYGDGRRSRGTDPEANYSGYSWGDDEASDREASTAFANTLSGSEAREMLSAVGVEIDSIEEEMGRLDSMSPSGDATISQGRAGQLREEKYFSLADKADALRLLESALDNRIVGEAEARMARDSDGFASRGGNGPWGSNYSLDPDEDVSDSYVEGWIERHVFEGDVTLEELKDLNKSPFALREITEAEVEDLFNRYSSDDDNVRQGAIDEINELFGDAMSEYHIDRIRDDAADAAWEERSYRSDDGFASRSRPPTDTELRRILQADWIKFEDLDAEMQDQIIRDHIDNIDRVAQPEIDLEAERDFAIEQWDDAARAARREAAESLLKEINDLWDKDADADNPYQRNGNLAYAEELVKNTDYVEDLDLAEAQSLVNQVREQFEGRERDSGDGFASVGLGIGDPDDVSSIGSDATDIDAPVVRGEKSPILKMGRYDFDAFGIGGAAHSQRFERTYDINGRITMPIDQADAVLRTKFADQIVKDWSRSDLTVDELAERFNITPLQVQDVLDDAAARIRHGETIPPRDLKLSDMYTFNGHYANAGDHKRIAERASELFVGKRKHTDIPEPTDEVRELRAPREERTRNYQRWAEASKKRQIALRELRNDPRYFVAGREYSNSINSINASAGRIWDDERLNGSPEGGPALDSPEENIRIFNETMTGTEVSEVLAMTRIPHRNIDEVLDVDDYGDYYSDGDRVDIDDLDVEWFNVDTDDLTDEEREDLVSAIAQYRSEARTRAEKAREKLDLSPDASYEEAKNAAEVARKRVRNVPREMELEVEADNPVPPSPTDLNVQQSGLLGVTDEKGKYIDPRTLQGGDGDGFASRGRTLDWEETESGSGVWNAVGNNPTRLRGDSIYTITRDEDGKFGVDAAHGYSYQRDGGTDYDEEYFDEVFDTLDEAKKFVRQIDDSREGEGDDGFASRGSGLSPERERVADAQNEVDRLTRLFGSIYGETFEEDGQMELNDLINQEMRKQRIGRREATKFARELQKDYLTYSDARNELDDAIIAEEASDMDGERQFADGFASRPDDGEALVSYRGGLGEPAYADILARFVVENINDDTGPSDWIREVIATEYLPNTEPGSDESNILKGILDGDGLKKEDYAKLPEALLDEIDEWGNSSGEYFEHLAERERNNRDAQSGFASRAAGAPTKASLRRAATEKRAEIRSLIADQRILDREDPMERRAYDDMEKQIEDAQRELRNMERQINGLPPLGDTGRSMPGDGFASRMTEADRNDMRADMANYPDDYEADMANMAAQDLQNNFARLSAEDQNMYFQRALANNADSGMTTEQILEEAKKLAMDDRRLAELERQSIGMGQSSKPRKIDVSSSSALNSVEYDEMNRRLSVEYRGRDGKGTGTVYSYDGVEPEVVDRIEAADSRGATMREVRDNYEFTTSRKLPESAYEGLASRGGNENISIERGRNGQWVMSAMVTGNRGANEENRGTRRMQYTVVGGSRRDALKAFRDWMDENNVSFDGGDGFASRGGRRSTEQYESMLDELPNLTAPSERPGRWYAPSRYSPSNPEAVRNATKDRYELIHARRRIAKEMADANGVAFNRNTTIYDVSQDEDDIAILEELDRRIEALNELQTARDQEFLMYRQEEQVALGKQSEAKDFIDYAESAIDDLDSFDKMDEKQKAFYGFDDVKDSATDLLSDIESSFGGDFFFEGSPRSSGGGGTHPSSKEIDEKIKQARKLLESDKPEDTRSALNLIREIAQDYSDKFNADYYEAEAKQGELIDSGYRPVSVDDIDDYDLDDWDESQEFVEDTGSNLDYIENALFGPTQDELEMSSRFPRRRLRDTDGFASRGSRRRPGRRNQGGRGEAMAPRRPWSAEDRQRFADGDRLRGRARPGKRRGGPDASEWDGFASTDTDMDQVPDVAIDPRGVFEGGEHGPGKDISLRVMWNNIRRSGENNEWFDDSLTADDLANQIGIPRSMAQLLLDARPQSGGPELFIDDPYLADKIQRGIGMSATSLFGFNPLRYYDEAGTPVLDEDKIDAAIGSERARRAARLAAREGRRTGKRNLYSTTGNDVDVRVLEEKLNVKLTDEDGNLLNPNALNRATQDTGLGWGLEKWRRIHSRGGALSPLDVEQLVGRGILDQSAMPSRDDRSFREVFQWPGFAELTRGQIVKALSETLGLDEEEIMKQRRTIEEALGRARKGQRERVAARNIVASKLKLTKTKIDELLERLGLDSQEFERWFRS